MITNGVQPDPGRRSKFNKTETENQLNFGQTLSFEQGRSKMRNINPAALAKILEKEGTDPITLVQIFWDEQQYVIYGDRAFLPEIKGQLLDLGEIENVINASQGSNSGSVNIRLNDTDGSLKYIHDSMDIHKRPVYILQWFPEIALKDAFVVFDGVISSPIVWKEGERTLSFDILSHIEDLEVGYSAEEGNFEYIPPNIIGQAWPFIFGTALRVPALRMNDPPEGFSNEDTGIDGTGEGQGAFDNIRNNEMKNISLLMEYERQCFTLAGILLLEAQALDAAFIRSSLGTSTGTINEQPRFPGGGLPLTGTIDSTTGLSGRFTRVSVYPPAQQLYDAATQLEEQGNKYLQERMRPMNVGVFGNPEMQALEKQQIRVTNGHKFPQGQNIIITINGAQHEGYFEGDVFTIVSRTFPYTNRHAVIAPTEVIDREVATEYRTNLGVQSFFYAIAGSGVGISSTYYPIYYIAGIPHVTVTSVLAKKTTSIVKFVIPPAYYTVQYKTFGTLQVTIIVMSRALSTRNEDWEDEIWCNCVSPIGPNAVDIMEYLVEHYTNQSIDTTSFAETKLDVEPYKCGFALLDRRNSLQVLEEIAYQSRCAIWFKGGRFFLKYLPKQGVPVTEFNETDVESGTMEVYSTETEDVVTKWSVTWRPGMDKEPPNKIVYRYHVKKYGLIDEDYECYIYNNQNTVQKFALFWLIRKANTWKKIAFSTFMTKLAVEPFDSVLINFAYPWVNDPACVVPTVGVVEKASYDSETQRIQMEIWLPIRLGEMCPYDFAYPSGVDTTLIFPQENDPGIQTNIPGAGAVGDLYDQADHTGATGEKLTTPENSGFGGGTPVGDEIDKQPIPPGQPGRYDPPTELSANDMINTGGPWVPDLMQNPPGVPNNPPAVPNNPDPDPSQAPVPIGPTISQRTIKPFDVELVNIPDVAYPGFVIGPDTAASGDEIGTNRYRVKLHDKGVNKEPITVVAKQLVLHSTDKIPEGTPCIVLRNCTRNEAGLVTSMEYTMQVPIWIAPKKEEEGLSNPGQSPEPPIEPPPPETDEGDQ